MPINTPNQCTISYIHLQRLLEDNSLSNESVDNIIRAMDSIQKELDDDIGEHIYPELGEEVIPIIYCNKNGQIQFIINRSCIEIQGNHPHHPEYTWYNVFKDIAPYLDELSQIVTNLDMPDKYRNMLIEAIIHPLDPLHPDDTILTLILQMSLKLRIFTESIKNELCSDDIEKYGLHLVNEVISNYNNKLMFFI